MASPAPRFSARCDQCEQEFQVPDPSKAYACKRCEGGRVRAVVPTCIECAEPLEFDAQYCPECGVDQAEDPSVGTPGAAADLKPVRPPRPVRKKSGKARSARRAVSSELNRALKSVRVLRAFFILNAIGHLILTAVALFGFTGAGGDRTMFILILGMQASMAAIMLAGVFMVMHQPAIWALVMACMVTLSRSLAAWNADWNIAVVGLGAIWALAFWALVAPAARAKRLMDEHPDLAAAKKLREDRPRAVRKSIFAGGGVIVVSVAAAVLLHLGSTAVPLGPTWTAFVSAWDEGDNAEVLRSIEDGMGASAREGFEAEIRGRGWTTGLPDLGAEALDAVAEFRLYSVDDPGSGSESVWVTTDTGRFEFGWSYREGEKEWQLIEMRWPRAEFPDVIMQRLEGAWASQNLTVLAGMFRQPDRAQTTLQRSFERRGWEQSLPEVQESSKEGSARGMFVYFQTDAGQIRFEFVREMGEWKIARFKLPDRG